VLTRLGKATQNTNPLLFPRVYIGNDSAEQFRWILETAFAGLEMPQMLTKIASRFVAK
jgi:hypothetical protein